ncbi:MAG: hypothetical protein NC313_12665 [Butyrivibrio sp.]|nr:hypothetical protein [Butyrivibrio sp.]
MLYAKPKNEALTIHEKAVEKYNTAYYKMENLGQRLYYKRCDCIVLIQKIESLVNSIANCPKEFEKNFSEIHESREKFRKTEDYVTEALKAAVKAGGNLAAGVAGGVAIASLSPSAAMWVATTFGTASTGTAISALHGAVATKAALVWLGGGALSAGGGGIAAGQAFLALAGPIGWGIAGTATLASVFSLGYKNKQIADEAIAEAKEITIAGAKVNETSANIQHLIDETVSLMVALWDMASMNRHLKDANYLELSVDEQYHLGAMVNNTLSLAEMLNKTL